MSQESNDFKLFKDLWSVLGGKNESVEGVAVDNLLYLLLIVRGAKIPNKEREIDDSSAEESEQLPGNLSKYTKID